MIRGKKGTPVNIEILWGEERIPLEITRDNESLIKLLGTIDIFNKNDKCFVA